MKVAYSNLIVRQSIDTLFFKTKVHFQGTAH